MTSASDVDPGDDAPAADSPSGGGPTAPDGSRPFDVVVFGATSFVGQILCRYLVERYGPGGTGGRGGPGGAAGPGGNLRWAMAGRNAAKLARVADEIGVGGPDGVERIVVDADDAAGLGAMAASTRVVVSTVGPYARYGSPVIAAVVGAGTDYCDLTGEPQWMRRMIDRHAEEAAASGARIVHACGFDSIPSDLGVWFTQQRAIERFGEPCVRVAMRVHAVRGGASGGTIASMMNLLDEVGADPELRRQLADPYLLAPADQRSGPPQREVVGPARDDASGGWVGPFVMAAVNTRVVQRTHALLGRPWGPGFTYDEATETGAGPLGAIKAAGLAAAVGVGVGLASIGPVRRLLTRVLPQPGSGPSPERQEAGFFDLRFTGHTADGRTIRTRVTGDRDPGYGGTARMLGEAAAALVELDRREVPGGFWTPASAFGDRLIERLEAHAGLRFDITDP